MKSIFTVLALSVTSSLAQSQPAQQPGVALTIYNQNFGVVRETRNLSITDGSVRFQDVAKQIDPTSVHFLSLTDPDAKVLEQNYEYDLVSADKLLEKYIDRDLTVKTAGGAIYTGKLQSFDVNQIVLAQADDKGLAMIQRPQNVVDIQFGALPEGLITKPSLVWKVATAKPGEQTVEIAYQTQGLGWSADYNLVLNPDETKADLGGWVTINNQSGATYKDAKLKLVAGDVNRVQPQAKDAQGMGTRMVMAEAAPAEAGFEEKSFFEYHLYTLGRPATVAENQTKQIELLSAHNLPLKKLYLYNGLPQMRFYGGLQTDENFGSEESNKKVKVFFEINNSKENNLGMALPKGKIRISKRDPADNSLEFVGEDEIDHTPKNEKIRITTGDAFDIVGERKRTNYTVNTRGRVATESFEIKVRNHKDTPVEVIVKETLYRWNQWEITESTDKWNKEDSNAIHFPVTIDKDGEKALTYTVKYSW
ncbi:MAG TPA: DUF4139 domain-containing protein [Chthoniobacterales bacterium]|jgi:hypothetical protein